MSLNNYYNKLHTIHSSRLIITQTHNQTFMSGYKIAAQSSTKCQCIRLIHEQRNFARPLGPTVHKTMTR